MFLVGLTRTIVEGLAEVDTLVAVVPVFPAVLPVAPVSLAALAFAMVVLVALFLPTLTA